MKRKFLSLMLVVVLTSIVNAHEFWLQPKKFVYQVGEEMKVDFMVGENFTGEFWDLTKHKAERLEIFNSFGRKDLLKEVKPTKGNNLAYKFAAEGTHLLVMQSNPAFIELEGEKFNAYLKEDGLEDILKRRTDRNELEQPAKEHYTRYAKLLVQAGGKMDEVYKRKIGLKLEIVPMANPYKLTSGDYLECKVFYDGKPGAHQLVKVWNIIGNRTFLQNIYTEDDGSLKFPISNKGPWMVSTVKMVPSQNTEVDYESMWASLVFGIE